MGSPNRHGRVKATVYRNGSYQPVVFNCPNCGAPLMGWLKETCKYCDSVVHLKDIIGQLLFPQPEKISHK